ncbi:nucleotide pyrophosphohydrolase [Weissella koreensis]|uniref:nucleotide pyrophosphohydrolase n=1 Tax=Weissella koreensis TaxID=165096 RepID=UPI000CF34281|nr:nucleotide pyrophosphohydrolase [Weissella koreensis]AVH74701.1 nucleotide pyrophosphohydrolase [Weissella koreensis]QGN19924.1 nucleotide pyrophosphohydrolase [Weissella koreensis]
MEIIDEINEFVNDRDWSKFHNSKDLAISISLEASELLEIYQWKSPEKVDVTDIEHIKEEVADVLIYSYMLADKLGLNMDEIVKDKIKKNKIKYPLNENGEI